jgi:hypothetical protein
MSNERIDLKQFEGMTEGPWKHVMPEHGWDDIMGANGELVSQVTLDNHIDGPSIAKLPELIAELKRCYEEIDRVRAIAEDLHAYIVSNADISLSVAEKQMDWV